MKYAMGIDIGGTKIAGGIINEQGDFIQREFVKSDPSDRESMFAAVTTCIDQLLDHSSIPLEDIFGIGVGVPGKVDREQGIAVYQTNVPWADFPLVERLQAFLKKDRIVIDNDVHMATFAEWEQAELTDELFVYMTISTGISSAAIQSGQFLRGAGFAGELGLVPVSAPYAKSLVERLEDVAAGPALETYARERLENPNVTAKQLFAAYYAKDERAIAFLEEAADALAQGVYALTSVLDPHKVVVGGSVATNNPVLVERIKAKLDNYLISEQKHILNNISTSHLGSDQGMLGAGLNVFNTFS